MYLDHLSLIDEQSRGVWRIWITGITHEHLDSIRIALDHKELPSRYPDLGARSEASWEGNKLRDS